MSPLPFAFSCRDARKRPLLRTASPQTSKVVVLSLKSMSKSKFKSKSMSMSKVPSLKSQWNFRTVAVD